MNEKELLATRSALWKLRNGQVSRRNFLLRGTAFAGAVALGGPLAACAGDEPAAEGGDEAEVGDEVNWLAWAGDADPTFLEPFERETGIHVNVQEYDSGERGIALVGQSPGRYDVITSEGQYTPVFVDSDLLAVLNPSDFPGYADFFPAWKGEFGQGTVQNGNLYQMVFKFDNLGFTYRTDKLTEADVASYEIMFDDKLTGRLGWGTHWANAMGEISVYAGNEDPFRISDEALEELKEILLSLAPQTRGFYSITDIFAGFASGEVWLNPGGGDWAALLLEADGHPIGASYPREGHTTVTITLGILKDTPRLGAAKRFVNYALSPEGQMRTALLPTYQSKVPSQAAWELMQREEPAWAKKLRMDTFDDPNALTPLVSGKGKLRQLPVEQSVEDWVEVWDEFRASL